jgi:DNA polymerase-3 subunit delta
MITIFLGENIIERDEAVRAYQNSFKNAHGELALFIIDAEADKEEQLLDAILSVPFFSDKKLVKIIGLEKNRDFLETIVKQNANIPDNVDVIIIANSFDGRLKVAQELIKLSTVREFHNYDRRQLEHWLNNYFHQEGASISKSDVSYLIDRVGEDQQHLYQEAKKLALLENVNKDTIDAMTNKSLSSTVFNLLDAMSAFSPKNALAIYNEQIHLGNEPLAVLGMISWQLYNVSLVFSGLKIMPKPELMKASAMSPFVFRKTVSVAEKLTRSQIIKYLDSAINAEYQIKNKPVNSQAVLKNLILQLSTK